MKLVAGLGLTGQSVLAYFHQQGKECIAFDTREDFSVEKLSQSYPTLKIYTAELPSDIIEQIDEVILSTGLALKSSWLAPFKEKQIPIIGDIELFARVAKQPIIAITGSNGKSTVTSLVAEILTEAGYKVGMGGNIGLPALDLLAEPYDVFVLELSSFQLETTYSLKAKIATVLNICEDHMDRYDSLAEYLQVKMTILNGAEQALLPIDLLGDRTEALSFGLDEPAHFHTKKKNGKLWLCKKNQLIIAIESMRLQGKHHFLNALAAMALTDNFKVSKQQYQTVFERFKGLAHRTQSVLIQDGIEWVNDSKGTNVGATITALSSLAKDKNIILIAGGVSKDADFSELLSAVKSYCKQVVLFGQDANVIYQALSKQYNKSKLSQVASLAEAVAKANSIAKHGDVVLFSPACASFDQFANYIKRGEAFEKLVKTVS